MAKPGKGKGNGGYQAHVLEPTAQRICRALEHHQPAAGTDAVKSMEHLVQAAYHKGLVIVFSDFLADPAIITDTLDRLRHRGHQSQCP